MAFHLKVNHQIQRGDRVGIMLKPGIDAYLSMLAILKCEATFVPIDPSFPQDRLQFIQEDARLCLVLNSTWMSNDSNRPKGNNQAIVRGETHENDLAYIIYTSGTTGKPKGVGITHANITNFLNVVPEIYGVSSTDRVYQGMTLSFDFSLEEIWPTWIAGASLLPPPNGNRLIGDELHEFLKQQRATVIYAVPTLLATIQEELPDLHTINVGGEACPQELVTRWSKTGRRILNTYGPTEATITASWTELSAARNVTIGKPLPSYRIELLDEKLIPVENGASGEICISGMGVSPGYINRPELTAEKFFIWQGERFYRTGDLGRYDANQEIEFLGRIDTQVKIRGHRIELGEIENILISFPYVANVLVKPYTSEDGATLLVGYLILDKIRDTNIELRKNMLKELQAKLPSYMIPAYIEILEEFPTLPSGKVDRSQLPPPTTSRLTSTDTEILPLESETEHTLAVTWCDLFKITEISAKANFFLDLGGDSLMAAIVISALRRQVGFIELSIGDLYLNPTIRDLGKYIDTLEKQKNPIPPRTIRQPSAWQLIRAGVVQFLGLYVLLIFFSETLVDALQVEKLGNWLLISFAYVLLSVFVWLLMPIAVKWIVIGRFKPGRYPLWGSYFLRWWIVRAALRFVPMDYLAGTPVMRLYLRLMGAKIGQGCYIGSRNLMLPDLVTIGEGAHIGYNVDVLAHEIRDGWLYLDHVEIGSGTYVGTNSVVFLGSTIEDNAMVGEQSLVPRHGRIPAGQYWQGSPVQLATMPETMRDLHSRETQTGVPITFGSTIAYLMGSVALYLMIFFAEIPCVALIEEPMKHHEWIIVLAWLIPGGLANVLFSCTVIAGAKWLILPRLKEGIYPINSSLAWRKWFCDKLVSTSLDVIYSVYATSYTKFWLRALGVKTGRGSEISTLNYFDPNMLTLGPYSFIADQATIGAAVFHKGWFAVKKTHVESKAFVGNCAHQSLGCHLESGSLLGVLSHKSGAAASKNTSWLGSPALNLQRREILTGFDDSLLYTPPQKRVWLRYFIEFFRIIIPQMVLSVAFVATIQMQQQLTSRFSMIVSLLLSPLCFFAVGGVMILFCATMKWLLVGSYRPRIAPLWSSFVWRSEMATSIYENISLPLFMNWFTGSPIFNMCLRLFGCNIGKRVYCDTTYITEFDLVHIGDDAAISENISLQTHLFEDRIMKLSYVKVGNGSVIGHRSVVLYDTDIAKESVLSPLSLVMKGEELPEKTIWAGIPARMSNDLNKIIFTCLILGCAFVLGTGVNSSELNTNRKKAVTAHDLHSSSESTEDQYLKKYRYLINDGDFDCFNSSGV